MSGNISSSFMFLVVKISLFVCPMLIFLNLVSCFKDTLMFEFSVLYLMDSLKAVFLNDFSFFTCLENPVYRPIGPIGPVGLYNYKLLRMEL